ncbi:helix-turn-helix domain-containing protein [Streptomyces sp. NPDC013178]|uniref:TetR/AcrR family transcriptional regulator n=1 Tax=Streptomyces sp. NPDC013178 TaxID=3155118 RepID=UPI003408E640
MVAAVEVLGQFGAQATIPQIAERAQVGKATVYRSFPTKEHLLETVTLLCLRELDERTRAADCIGGPLEAFRHFVLELFDALATHRLLAERLADASSPAAMSVLHSLTEAMESARDAGLLREDAGRMDLRVLLCGAVLQLVRLGERDTGVWRRYADMVVASLLP